MQFSIDLFITFLPHGDNILATGNGGLSGNGLVHAQYQVGGGQYLTTLMLKDDGVDFTLDMNSGVVLKPSPERNRLIDMTHGCMSQTGIQHNQTVIGQWSVKQKLPELTRVIQTTQLEKAISQSVAYPVLIGVTLQAALIKLSGLLVTAFAQAVIGSRPTSIKATCRAIDTRRGRLSAEATKQLPARPLVVIAGHWLTLTDNSHANCRY
jgi:hypothetical protein